MIDRLSLIAVLLFTSASPGLAQRPPAPQLLPEETILYFRIEEASGLRQAVRASSLGKIASDPQVQPLLGELYGGIAQLAGRFQEQIGASLDEILRIPQGEVAFALIPIAAEGSEGGGQAPEAARDEAPRRGGGRSRLGFVGLIDAREQIPLLMSIVDKGEQQMVADGWQRSARTVAGTEIVLLRRGQRRELAYSEVEGALLLASDAGALTDLLYRWKGDEGDRSTHGGTLAENVDFSTALSQCLGAEEETPQVTFYVTPSKLLKQVAPGMVYSILEELGVTGIRGIAGSQLVGGETYEAVMHLHVSLESPRNGLLAVIRPGTGSLRPEPWVPQDVEGYTTLNWQVSETFDAVERIVTRFTGPENWQSLLETADRRLGVDLQTDVIEHLTGRISVLSWYEMPARINSRVFVVAAETDDAEHARQTVEKILARHGPEARGEAFGAARLYRFAGPGGPRNSGGADRPEGMLRTAEPHLALIDRYVLMTSSRELIERIARTAGDPDAPRLGDLPEYDLVLGEASSRLDGREPFLTVFQRPEKAFRFYYELARSPNARASLRRMGENNPLAAVVSRALENHQLPPFGVVAQYLAPGGGIAYDDPTGLHYIQFTLPPQE